MMLLLRLFLLVMLIRDSSSDNTPSVPVKDCDKMACFTTPTCRKMDSTSTNIHYLVPDESKVLENCEAILKIRKYSDKHYLIVMKSNDQRIKQITLKQGKQTTTIFGCISDGTQITAKYNEEILKTSECSDSANLVKQKLSCDKLSCEFFVKKEKVFDSLADEVELGTPITKVTMDGVDFHVKFKKTCDPEDVKPATLGAVGDKTISAVDVQLADLVCPADKKLMFRKDSTSDFKEATSITCKKYSESKYEFEPKLDKAQCAVATCTQCTSTMAPPIPNLETYDEGGCTKLRCKNNDRIKLGSAAAVEGSAECKFENNEHVWQLKGTTIKVDSTIECQGKVKCFSTEDDVKKVCKDCSLGPDNLPKCEGETSSLMYETVKMSIFCDDITGKYVLNDGTQNYTELKSKLHCEDKKANDDAAAAEAQNASEGSMKTALFIVLPILGLGALGGVGFAVWRLRSRKAVLNDKKAAEEGQKKNPDTKSGKSLESRAPANDEEKQLAAQRARIAEVKKKLEEERRELGDLAKNVQDAGGAVPAELGDNAVCALDLAPETGPAMTEAAPQPDSKPSRQPKK